MDAPIKPGDIRYSKHDGKVHVFKVLRIDEHGTYHILSYGMAREVPQISDIEHLDVRVWHSPVGDLSTSEFLINKPVSEEELQGYWYYLKTTNFEQYCKETGQSVEELVKRANACYNEAYALTDDKKYIEAIGKYEEAVDAFPFFFEAIDNMAFVKMKMGRYNDAIDDFRWSLQVEPKSVLAEFSIGECYYKLKDYESALEQFDRALAIQPNDELSLLFREKTTFLLEGGTEEELEQVMSGKTPPKPEKEEDKIEKPEEMDIPATPPGPMPEDDPPVPGPTEPKPKKKKRWWPF